MSAAAVPALPLPFDHNAPAADSDGYVAGQRDRALVLDFYARVYVGTLLDDDFPDHPACRDLTIAELACAIDGLKNEGLLSGDGPEEAITPAGFAAHAAAQRALDAVAGAITTA